MAVVPDVGEVPGVPVPREGRPALQVFFFFITLVTGPRRSLSLKLSDTRVYEPQIRARLRTTAHFCRVSALTFSLSDGSRAGEVPTAALPGTFPPECGGDDLGRLIILLVGR